MAAPQVPVISVTPNPFTQTEQEFNADTQTYHNELPGTINGINNVANFVETQGNSAEASSTAAANSAATASGSANFKGNWSSLSGALSIPSSVQHSGSLWLLINNLADVTASEPSSGNSDWRDITPLANPFTTDGQIIISGPSGVIQVLNPPADDTGDYSLTYDSATQSLAWGEGGGGGAIGADLGAIVIPAVGNGSQTVNIDMSLGAVFVVDMSSTDTAGSLTLTASNIPANGFDIHLYIRRAGRKNINFPAGWDWNQNFIPALASGSNDYTLINVNRPPFFSSGGASLTVTTEQANK